MPSSNQPIRSPVRRTINTPMVAYAAPASPDATFASPSATIMSRQPTSVRMGPALFNDLEGPVSRRHPEVAETKAAFLEAGALGAVMSGSGPAVAALARTPQDAERLAEAVPGAFVAAGLARMG